MIPFPARSMTLEECSLLTNPSLGAADANQPPSKLVLDPTQDEILLELANFFEGARLIGADAIVCEEVS